MKEIKINFNFFRYLQLSQLPKQYNTLVKCGLTSHKVTTIWIALQTGKKDSKYSFLNGDVMIQHSQINKALKIDIGW